MRIQGYHQPRVSVMTPEAALSVWCVCVYGNEPPPLHDGVSPDQAPGER